MAGSAVSASTAPPAGSEAAPARAITPFGPTMMPGRREAVDRQQRGHRRERGAEQHGAAVVGARARDASARPRRCAATTRRSRRARSGPTARSGPPCRRTRAARQGRPPPRRRAAPAVRAVRAPASPLGALSADQRTMCSPMIEGTAASPLVIGSGRSPASSTALPCGRSRRGSRWRPPPAAARAARSWAAGRSRPSARRPPSARARARRASARPGARARRRCRCSRTRPMRGRPGA